VHRAYAELDAWYDGGTHGTIEPAGLDEVRLLVPIVVLHGPGAASAAEDFLVAIDAIPHVTTVGQPTFGSTGQPFSFPLPGGSSARICTKRDTYPAGREFVSIGIQPQVVVQPTVEDVRAGRDPALERAVALLGSGSDG
jgi:carboxyl-terminal processing protease